MSDHTPECEQRIPPHGMEGGSMLIACNRSAPMEANPGDCVWLTFVGNRHTPVNPGGLCGTITTREGELGVVVKR